MKKENEERKEKKEEKEEKEKEKKGKREKKFILSLILILALIISFFGIYLFSKSKEERVQTTNQTISETNKTNQTNEIKFELEKFLDNLKEAESLAIVENLTKCNQNEKVLIMTCGVGLAQGWGESGKNISKLWIYVIENGNCSYGSVGEIENNTADFCYEMYKDDVMFYLTCGPSSTIFEEKKANVLIDKSFEKKCKLFIPS